MFRPPNHFLPILWQVAVVASWRCTLFDIERWFQEKLTLLRDGWEPISKDKSGTFHNRMHTFSGAFAWASSFSLLFFVRIFCNGFLHICFGTCFWCFFCLSEIISSLKSLKNIFSVRLGEKSWTRPKNNLTCCKSKAETGRCSRSTGRRIVLQTVCVFFAYMICVLHMCCIFLLEGNLGQYEDRFGSLL